MSKTHHRNRYEDTSEYTDPVCKMKVSKNTAIDLYEHKGETYYFCSTGCKTSFEKNPDNYINTKF